jgi:hypothetical protein
MGEVADHQRRPARREAARTQAHEDAGPGREQRRRGDTSRSPAVPRWRFTNAVEAARKLNMGNEG